MSTTIDDVTEAMKDVVDSVGLDRTKELLVYYFKTGKNGHPLNFFFFNFDRLDQLNIEMEKDAQNRKFLLQQTKKLVEGGE